MSTETPEQPEPAECRGEASDSFSDLLCGSLELVVDPIDEALEEISAIAAAWQKNRDRKRPSPILRRALIHAAQELVDEVHIFHKRQSDEAKDRAV
jgi:hypothetical protein